MARLARKSSSSKVYHVIFRGINKQDIFFENEDYQKMIDILSFLKEEMKFKMYAYCFMNNHVHLLIEEFSFLQISLILKRLLVRYVGWYNKKYQRTGKLINDRYVSMPVMKDSYFLNVIRYIHQNPIKINLPLHYTWSSFNSYINEDKNSIIDTKPVFSIMSKEEFLTFNLTEEKQIFEPNEKITPADSEVINHIKKVYQVDPINIATLERNDKKEILKKLKATYSIRQISRVTGISKGSIQRI